LGQRVPGHSNPHRIQRRANATTESQRGSEIISGWPDESREAAELVIDEYGEP
jgi:hypothetical protein